MSATEQNKRIDWIDMLRGLAIVCVILGHRQYGTSGILAEYFVPEIYSFHIPLFFFVSGLVFSVSKYKNFGEFLVKKIKTILFPMVLLSLVNILFKYVYYGNIVGISKYGTKYFVNRLIGIVLQLRDGKYESCLWFLTCLFITQCILYWIIKILKDKTIPILITIICCALVGSIYMYFKLPKLPWEIDVSFVAMLFVGIGYILKKEKATLEKINKLWLAPFLIVINILTMYANYKFMGNKNIDLAYNKIGMPLWFFLESIAGIWVLFIIFSRFKNIRPLSYIGKNSLVYYGLLDLMVFIPEFIIFNIIHLNVLSTGNWSVLINIIYTIVVCITIIPIVELVNRKLPFIKGQF